MQFTYMLEFWQLEMEVEVEAKRENMTAFRGSKAFTQIKTSPIAHTHPFAHPACGMEKRECANSLPPRMMGQDLLCTGMLGAPPPPPPDYHNGAFKRANYDGGDDRRLEVGYYGVGINVATESIAV